MKLQMVHAQRPAILMPTCKLAMLALALYLVVVGPLQLHQYSCF